MSKYRSEGISLPELVDREQEHTWCLMKIAQPLGWERLCSDVPTDLAFNMARLGAIQNCETRYQMVTKPIKECFNEELVKNGPQSAMTGWGSDLNQPNIKPAACLSFQYSRKVVCSQIGVLT